MSTHVTVPRRTALHRRLAPILITLLLLVLGGWAVRAFLLTGAPTNLLLMGVDQDKTRTDVILVAHIDPQRKVVSLVSIPRDTLVEIPCEGLTYCLSPDKINHAHAYGGDQGPEVTVRAVEGFLGIPIDGYIRVDFDAFQRAVDQLGGISLVIENDMHYEDPYATPPLQIHFTASEEPQHLDGKAALEFVRYRSGDTGDIGRTQRTRALLIAMLKQVQENGLITELPQLATTMLPYVKTDLNASTMMTLAAVAPSIDPEGVQMASVPGAGVFLPDGRWIWQANAAETQELLDRLVLHKQKVSSN